MNSTHVNSFKVHDPSKTPTATLFPSTVSIASVMTVSVISPSTIKTRHSPNCRSSGIYVWENHRNRPFNFWLSALRVVARRCRGSKTCEPVSLPSRFNITSSGMALRGKFKTVVVGRTVWVTSLATRSNIWMISAFLDAARISSTGGHTGLSRLRERRASVWCLILFALVNP